MMTRSKAEDWLDGMAMALNVGAVIVNETGDEVEHATVQALRLLRAASVADLRRAWPTWKSRLLPPAGSVIPIDSALVQRHPLEPGWLLILRDVQTASAFEAEVRDAAKLRLLEHLFAAAAHDLKTPLNAVSLNLDLLRESLGASTPGATGTERQLRNLALATTEIQRLKQMLNGLMDEVRRRDTSMEPQDLSALLRELHETLRALGMRRGVTVETQLETDRAIVHGRRDLLRQAVLHAAIRAFEAMPDGGQLTVRLTRADQRLVLSVSAGGIGAAHAATLDIDDESDRDLHVLRQIIAEHGGSVRAEATAAGPIVHLELPAA